MVDLKESVTAKLCSFARAYHSNYSRKKIFDDYLAYDLMGKEEYEEIWRLIELYFSDVKHGFSKEINLQRRRRTVWQAIKKLNPRLSTEGYPAMSAREL